MTQKNEDKRGGPDARSDYNGKVEARFTKEAKAKTGQDGKIKSRAMGRDHADNTGGQGHPDKGPA